MGWGANDYGQLGIDGDSSVAELSAQIIPDLTHIVSIAAGRRHSVVLKDDGSVWAFGNAATHWEFMIGVTTNYQRFKTAKEKKLFQATPTRVTGLPSIKAIAAGYAHSLALAEDGTVWAWGDSNCGALGIVPVHWVRQEDFDAGKYKRFDQKTHDFRVREGDPPSFLDNSEKTWDDGPQETSWRGALDTPVQIPGLTDVVAIAAGMRHSLALKADGTIWGWGGSEHGEIGKHPIYKGFNDLSITSCPRAGVPGYSFVPFPGPVPGISDVTAIAAGNGYSMAIRKDQTLWVWGSCVMCDRTRALINQKLREIRD